MHVRRGWLLRSEQLARSRIRAIHYYPDIIGFRGPDGKPVMRTRAEWSLKEMIAVAAELRIPVYDNRQCFNLVRAKTGQLVYDPFDDRPAG